MFQFCFFFSLYKLAAAYAITHAVPHPCRRRPLLLSSWYSWTIQLLGAVSEDARHPTAWKCPTGGIRAPFILVTPDKAARLKRMETTSLFTSIPVYSSYPTNSNDFAWARICTSYNIRSLDIGHVFSPVLFTICN